VSASDPRRTCFVAGKRAGEIARAFLLREVAVKGERAALKGELKARPVFQRSP
jgi:hypothetical protein